MNRHMRKTISNMYFTTTAILLVAGITVMGFVQMYLSMSYFVSERKSALSSVVQVAAKQVSLLQQGEELPQLSEEDRDRVQRAIGIVSETSDSSLLLADAQGNVVLAAGFDRALGAQIPRNVLDQMAGGQKAMFDSGTLGGVYDKGQYTAGCVLTDAAGQVRGYAFASSNISALNGYVADMFSTFILSAGLMLLISSLLSVVFTTRLTLPLRRIAEAARKFGAGDFSTRVPVEGEDEVAQLAVTFNNMAANLEAIDSSRSNFMGNIAHELRTPMTSVKGFVDGMLDGTIPPEMQHHYLEIVSQETGRLARLVQNMLDITKLEAGEYKVHACSYDVWETLTGVLLANEQRVLAGKIVINDLAPVPTMVYADPDLVHQVVQNLMDNALKFTPPGGNIRFDVKRLQPGIVEVSITNTGEGISPEALPFVFQRFYKEDASRGLNAKGSGLGLHICKVLITLSGGTIRVDSKQGEWCRFTFTLPEPPAPPRQRRGGKKEG